MKILKDLKLKDDTKLLALSLKKLREEMVSAEKQMFVMRMKLKSGELKQTHFLKFLKRYIAKINTMISAKLYAG